MIDTKGFVDKLDHDSLVRLNASLRYFLGYDDTKREAYVNSLVNFPETENELVENIDSVISMSGKDFFNNITYADGISG